jgi:hypothetical protein
MHIKLRISEPWELGEAMEWQAVTGLQLRVDVVNGLEGALIKLDEPINFRGSDWHYVVCTPRHSRDSLVRLDRNQSIVCAITGISETQAVSDHPCDLATWRGGLACIGDIALADR